MKEKIAELKQIIDDIDTMIWLLEGKSSKSMRDDDGTVRGEIGCYKNEGTDLQNIIDSILENHGSEILPTED